MDLMHLIPENAQHLLNSYMALTNSEPVRYTSSDALHSFSRDGWVKSLSGHRLSCLELLKCP
jgi:hypothetical protein